MPVYNIVGMVSTQLLTILGKDPHFPLHCWDPRRSVPIRDKGYASFLTFDTMIRENRQLVTDEPVEFVK